jgi:hypothetical protein
LSDFAKKKVVQSESKDERRPRGGAIGTAIHMAHCPAEQFLPTRFLLTVRVAKTIYKLKGFFNLYYPSQHHDLVEQ